MGYFVETDRATGKVVREGDTIQCSHCQFTMEVEPAKRAAVIVRAAVCGCCSKPVCGPCQAKGGCDVWEKWMERHESRARMLKAVGGG